MKRRSFQATALLALPGVAALGTAPAGAQTGPAPAAAPRKVLKVAFRSAETNFDPSNISDLFSRTITAHIFEAMYQYDHLARPARIKPLLAEGMPEVSADFKTWTIPLRAGIFFADDPAFKGQRREMVAKDLAFAFQRIADPALKSQLWTWVETFGIAGLAEYRRELVQRKQSFDYDRPIAGLQVLDRHLLRIQLDKPQPRFLGSIAGSDLLGAQAREVVDFYGDQIAAHPVGTGPYRLKSWRRSSQIVLERNPQYRERFYDAEPAADDREGQAILARLKGRRLPIIDEIHVQVIPEDQPRWLSFLNGQLDMIAGQYGPVPEAFTTQAVPGGKLAPNLQRQGITGRSQLGSDLTFTYFNMEDPVVGGYTPDKVALRRAISLAMDVPREVSTIWRGMAVPAQSHIVPHTTGYDPAFKSETGDHDPARARALLDVYGYVDRDGDGWREQPDGSPLSLEMATLPQQVWRQRDELFRKNMQAVGIRVSFRTGEFAEMLKNARAGKLQMWTLATSAAGLDGHSSFARLHGRQAGGQNLARFKLPAFDEIYERMEVIPDGPEREALFLAGKKLGVAYMPYRPRVHRISTDLWYDWVIGFRRPLFWQEWWHMIDIDTARQAQRRPGSR
ncbi:MAG: bicyclomycin resistance protein [Rubrivivax sp.]|nr:bicyclomycin resistance protein [Rubrivivax sp.]